jgi:MOSC domain-containing protein YiiM
MSAGRVLHVCISSCKGTPKQEVSRAELRAGYGLEGDAHADGGPRQVSLLNEADIAEMRSLGLELAPGAFGENLVIDGLELGRLEVGARLQVGQALLEVTQIGKECHHRCAIYERAGDCIMPRAGVFAHVLVGGEVRAGAPVTYLPRIP